MKRRKGGKEERKEWVQKPVEYMHDNGERNDLKP